MSLGAVLDVVESVLDFSFVKQFTAEDLTKSEGERFFSLSKDYQLHFKRTSEKPIKYSVIVRLKDSNGAYK